MNEQESALKPFQIRVGHWEICLKARDAEEAIQLARRQMARELPRLYDVIQMLTASRFLVEAAA
jgi:hypothetical protein